MAELKLRAVTQWAHGQAQMEIQVCSKASRAVLPTQHPTASNADPGYLDSVRFSEMGFTLGVNVFISFLTYLQLISICFSTIFSAVWLPYFRKG